MDAACRDFLAVLAVPDVCVAGWSAAPSCSFSRTVPALHIDAGRLEDVVQNRSGSKRLWPDTPYPRYSVVLPAAGPCGCPPSFESTTTDMSSCS
jgi:hypothetical protein